MKEKTERKRKGGERGGGRERIYCKADKSSKEKEHFCGSVKDPKQVGSYQ